MHLFILIVGIFIQKIYANSNFNSDYPNVTICVIPDQHGYKLREQSYTYLKKTLGLDKNCTHISGSLYIQGVHRLENGMETDLSFLESIVEISGILRISGNFVKRIPLGNLKIIRGASMSSDNYSLAIEQNNQYNNQYLEEVDLHSLRAIMNKGVRINNNYGLDYLSKNVNWSEIIMNPNSQALVIQAPLNNNTMTYHCHPNCTWGSKTSNNTKFCFGPNENQCQKRSKCATITGITWCDSKNGIEIPCHSECAGGCFGSLSSDCVVCSKVYKKDKCVSHCTPEQSNQFGHFVENNIKDKLIYTTGGLCTSRCPDSLLDQDKICLYKCDFSKYYKRGNRCLECPNQQCYNQIGNQLMCDLKKLDPNYPKNGMKYRLNKETLLKLTNCTVIVGQFSIDDASFIHKDVTLPLLYENLKNVREVIGEVVITLLRTNVTNIAFLPNLKEIRGISHTSATLPGLKIFVSTLEFLGLKRLEKVYGVVNFNHKSNLCYTNTIPWKEINKDTVRIPKCDKKCHPLCTRGCWGPGNELCYKCPLMEAGNYCVTKCEDVPRYYTWIDQLKVNKSECRLCHPLCKDSCTGPSSRDCTSCLKAKENGNCVNSCSNAYYPVTVPGNDNNTCIPCHDSCYVGEMLKSNNISSACSGPSDKIGQGGCSMCNKIITKNNITSCHKGSCPRGYFNSFNTWSVQQISCNACHPYCEECTGKGTQRHSCQKCKMFWYQNNCQSVCPEKVLNISRKVSAGQECPSCHVECRGGCHTEKNNSTCLHCVHKKVFKNFNKNEFFCVPHCPLGKNYSEIIDDDSVCLTYEETMYHKQQRKILFIIIGCFTFLVVAVIAIVLIFRFKSKQNKIKIELNAYYSNFNEPNMKNLPSDHLTRPPNMNRLQMIPLADLIFDCNSKPLGAGAFGKVFRGYWNVLGGDGNMHLLPVVVKVMHNSSKASTNEFLDEAQIMASVSHRHCLPLIGVCLSLEKPCLVSTFAKYGSLDKYLVQHSSTIPSLSLLKWSEQIADGMTYLNMRGIIHRDLAARNILLNQDNIVQITDFGLARLVDDTEDGIVVKSGRVPIRWLALETLLYSNYSTASDIWAYGVTLWEIFTYGKRPYEELETSKIKVYLQEGNRLSQPDICTLEVYMVMIKCWLEEPQMRSSFHELMTTFELFAHNSKRYLCLPSEHIEEYPYDTNIEAICLRDLDPQITALPILNPRSDYNLSNRTNFTNNDSVYHLINNSYVEEPARLPKRKKTKRNISFDKLKGFPKINFTKLKSNKSLDSKVVQYRPSVHRNYVKEPCMSYDSSTGLISSHRSSEYDSHPLNPQISKILTQDNWQGARDSKSMSKHYVMHSPKRIFNDKELRDEDRNILVTPIQLLNNKSQKVPPIEIHKFDSKEILLENPLKEININPIRSSLDSGNSQDLEADDYLIPSRVQSLGYYNLTPSPTTSTKPTLDLSNSSVVIHNDSLTPFFDDGYLEPTSK